MGKRRGVGLMSEPEWRREGMEEEGGGRREGKRVLRGTRRHLSASEGEKSRRMQINEVMRGNE